MDITGAESGYSDEPHGGIFDDATQYDAGPYEGPYDDPPVDDAAADSDLDHMTSVAEDYSHAAADSTGRPEGPPPTHPRPRQAGTAATVRTTDSARRSRWTSAARPTTRKRLSV